jgi:catechol 1,2-dioxygenase
MNFCGKFTTDVDGRIWFRSVARGYPIPTDGGRLLQVQDRHPSARRMSTLVFRGLQTLTSRNADTT